MSRKKYKSKNKKPFAALVSVVISLFIAATAACFISGCSDVSNLTHSLLGTGEHTYGEYTIIKAATCGTDGIKTHTCTICGAEQSEVIAATGEHTYGEYTVIAEGDCTTDKVEERVCSVCGKVDQKTTAAVGHTYGEYTVTKAATCGTAGEKTRTCTICGAEQSEVIVATGEHTYGDYTVTQEATCGKAGERTHTCTVCGEVETEEIAATGEHTYAEGSEICSVCGYDNSSFTGTLEEVSESTFSIHFLELGNKYAGDSTLIKYGDTEVLIDAGSRQNSATTIKAYVDTYCTDGVLEYVIATHAHQDHIAGFVGSKSGSTMTGILYQYKVGTLIQFAGHNTTSQIYSNYVVATQYAAGQGASVYTAKQCWYEEDGAKKQYDLSPEQDGSLTMNILYNYYYENETSDENDYSVCMLLTYTASDGTKSNYLFTGDLEETGEKYLVQYNDLPEVDLFKGGHHGSKTSSTEALLSKIKPKHVAVCCCAGSTEYTTNNDNTFPTQAFIDRVSVYTDSVYVTTLCVDYDAGTYTSMNGNIVFYVTESGKLKLYCSNNTTKLKDTEWFKTYRTCPSNWA